MARPAITYTETFKCPECKLTIALHAPNGDVWHPCRVNGKLQMVKFESVNVWRKEETKEKEVYKQGILNL